MTKIGSIIGQRIDYNGVGAYPVKINPSIPLRDKILIKYGSVPILATLVTFGVSLLSGSSYFRGPKTDINVDGLPDYRMGESTDVSRENQILL